MAAIKRIKMTQANYRNMAENDEGMCVRCHAVHDGLEPDARKCICDECDQPAVYGIEELLIMGMIDFVDR